MIEGMSALEIAQLYGTPCYVYSRAALTQSYQKFAAAFTTHPALICFAVKSNPNLAVLNLFARLGSGFDIVSGGELSRVLAAGGSAQKVVFSGVGKSRAEITQALLAGILCFNVESASELDRINEIAGKLQMRAPVSLRVNPDVDAKTHPYIATGLKESKFGVAFNEAIALYQRAKTLKNLTIKGIDCHIGSQLTDIAPFLAATDRVLALVDALREHGIELSHIDLGGGLGIPYETHESAPPIEKYASAILEKMSGRKESLIFEPGRYLTGNAGFLLTQVEYLKEGQDRHFAIVNAAMNDLMRPALYSAWHDIIPAQTRDQPEKIWDIVGPVCESGDFLGRSRSLALMEGDLLVIRSAGAYGMSMSSNYNTRPRAAEVMIDGKNHHLIREREKINDLFSGEFCLPL